MKEKLTTLVQEALVAQLEALPTIENVDERSKAVNDFCSMYKLSIEDFKTLGESVDRMNRSKNDKQIQLQEQEIKRQQLLADKKDRYVKIGIGAATFAVALFNVGLVLKGYHCEFKENHIVSSPTLRGLTSKLGISFKG